MKGRIEEKDNFIRKRVSTIKGKKNTKESIVTSQAPKGEDFLEKLLIILQGEIGVGVGHVAT